MATKKLTERVVMKRNFPTDPDHDGKTEPRTVYVGETSHRFYSKEDHARSLEQFGPRR